MVQPFLLLAGALQSLKTRPLVEECGSNPSRSLASFLDFCYMQLTAHRASSEESHPCDD